MQGNLFAVFKLSGIDGIDVSRIFTVSTHLRVPSQGGDESLEEAALPVDLLGHVPQDEHLRVQLALQRARQQRHAVPHVTRQALSYPLHPVDLRFEAL